MKRLLFLNSEFPPIGGGASPVSYDIAKRLSENGFDIDVVTSSYKGLPHYEEINEHLRIHRTPSLRAKKEISQPYEQLSYLISAFFTVLRLHKTKKFELCYTHFIIPTGALAWLLKLLIKLPYVITSHGSDVLGHNSRFAFLYKILSLPWKMILNGAERVTVPSQHLYHKVLAAHPTFPSEKLIVIPNIVEQGMFSPMEKEKYIFMISRLHPQKGMQDVLTAFARIKPSGWTIKIAGDGPYKQALQQQVNELGLQESVDFLGWVTNIEKKRELYGKAAVYINPSYAESFGITTVEALQAGCYCIVSDTGIAEQLTGVSLYHKGNIEELEGILSDILTRTSLSASSSHKDFYAEKVLPQLINVLH